MVDSLDQEPIDWSLDPTAIQGVERFVVVQLAAEQQRGQPVVEALQQHPSYPKRMDQLLPRLLVFHQMLHHPILQIR